MDEEVIIQNPQDQIQDKEVQADIETGNEDTSNDLSENTTVDNNGEIIVSTTLGDVPLSMAMYQEQIKTNFFLSLILTVTVVFFVINKFWSFCRRLFTVNID